jgi:hypothetical protein
MVNHPNDIGKARLPVEQISVIAALLIFTIIIGWSLLAGTMTPAQGFLWLGVCCLFPFGWYCYGYFQVSDQSQSNALLLNAIGWVLVAMGFLVHYKTLLDTNPGAPSSQIPTSALTVLLLLGLFILVVAGLLSWQAVHHPQSPETKLTP